MEAKYHPMRAAGVAIGNAIALIIIPVYILRTLPTIIPVDIPLDLESMERTIITIGAAAVGLAALTAFYAKGLLWRAAFGSARQGVRVAWIYLVLGGGILNLDVGLIEDLAVSFFVDFQRLLYILYAGMLIMAAYFVLEFFVYRTVWRDTYYAVDYYEESY